MIPSGSNQSDHSADCLGDAGYRRCVIYTRKSSQDGLEQDFNSLHAQREACEAYVKSQRQEGWRLLRGMEHQYDDPGLSGGNMDRPGLQGLLNSIESGLVDVVVVYKVDRLTRALSDFAKIIEIMDANNVSFVSVTQSFNTTSSMGRLTLNVLLSFAQFEREVTAERIRDKIAASKAKGIWMGGPIPLGYTTQNKRLIIHADEANIVQSIFEAYLRTGSLIQTKKELDAKGIRTRRRTRRNGSCWGAIAFSHGAIQSILRNPVYVGRLRHKGKEHEGEHGAIIREELFQRVNEQLDQSTGGNKRRPKARNDNQQNGRMLAGLLYDSAGYLMTPTHSKKNGVRYRYYVSTAIAKNEKDKAGKPYRIAAEPIETAVKNALTCNVPNSGTSPKSPHNRAELTKIQARTTQCTITGELVRSSIPTRNSSKPCRKQLTSQIERIDLNPNGALIHLTPRGVQLHQVNNIGIEVDFKHLPRREQRSPARTGAQTGKVNEREAQRLANQRLLFAIARATQWYNKLKNREVESISQLATQEGHSIRSVRLNLNLAWIAPDIVQAAIENKLSALISPTELARNLPVDWNSQRSLLGPTK